MSLASLQQLDRSHRRHDDVMAQLLEAARRLAAGRPHDTDLDVVRDAVAYFERAVTRHFLDEEGSVFPRLSTRRPELAEALAALSAEHPAQIALQNAVAEAVKHLDDDARPGAGKALLEVAEKLAEQHRRHVDREDEIFRDAHEALTADDDSDIVAEMETRRDRDADNGSHIRSGGRSMGGGGGSGASRGMSRSGGGGGGGGRGTSRSGGSGGGGGGGGRGDRGASRGGMGRGGDGGGGRGASRSGMGGGGRGTNRGGMGGGGGGGGRSTGRGSNTSTAASPSATRSKPATKSKPTVKSKPAAKSAKMTTKRAAKTARSSKPATKKTGTPAKKPIKKR